MIWVSSLDSLHLQGTFPSTRNPHCGNPSFSSYSVMKGRQKMTTMRCLNAAKWFSTRVSGSFSLCEALQCRDGITDVLGLCCGQGKWDKYSLCSGFFGFSVFRLQRFLLVFYYRCAGATWAAFRGAFGPLVVADFGKLQTLNLIETRTSSRDMPASLRPVHYALSFRLNVIFWLNSDFRQAWLYDGKQYAKICRIILR